MWWNWIPAVGGCGTLPSSSSSSPSLLAVMKTTFVVFLIVHLWEIISNYRTSLEPVYSTQLSSLVSKLTFLSCCNSGQSPANQRQTRGRSVLWLLLNAITHEIVRKFRVKLRRHMLNGWLSCLWCGVWMIPQQWEEWESKCWAEFMGWAISKIIMTTTSVGIGWRRWKGDFRKKTKDQVGLRILLFGCRWK